MGSIKIFVIFAVGALNLAVMPRCVGLYEFVLYATLFDAGKNLRNKAAYRS